MRATHVNVLSIGANTGQWIVIRQQSCAWYILLVSLENTAAHLHWIVSLLIGDWCGWRDRTFVFGSCRWVIEKLIGFATKEKREVESGKRMVLMVGRRKRWTRFFLVDYKQGESVGYRTPTPGSSLSIGGIYTSAGFQLPASKITMLSMAAVTNSADQTLISGR